MLDDKIFPKRLKTISTYLSKGTNFADIGSDHALLPAYVCLNDPEAKAIAGEVNEGPYKSAVETVKRYDLTSKIDVRLGNGLEVLNDDEINEIVIAGMGGTLITSILHSGKRKLDNVQKIIAQPNNNAKKVRHWLYMNQYIIKDETLVKENDHIYEIIVAVQQPEEQGNLNDLSKVEYEKLLMFGPILLKDRPHLFHEKWLREKNKHENTIKQMKKATRLDYEKINQFEIELKWIQEVLF